MSNRIYAAIAALAIAGFFATIALSQSPPISPYDQYADVDGNGVVNIADRGIVALNSNTGATWPVNPCVPYRVIDDAHPYETPADGALVINTLGEIITPARGGAYAIPPSHPAYAALGSGSPWPLRPCP